ncbi:MAG: hypothetical protein IKT70_08725 [Clostridia bacterium]|nr:hypothetical protein [Clostridia bacterium]
MKKYIFALVALLTVSFSFLQIRYTESVNMINPMTSDLPIVPIIILGGVAVVAAIVFIVMGAIAKKRR